jgi:hypothetical protein
MLGSSRVAGGLSSSAQLHRVSSIRGVNILIRVVLHASQCCLLETPIAFFIKPYGRDINLFLLKHIIICTET